MDIFSSVLLQFNAPHVRVSCFIVTYHVLSFFSLDHSLLIMAEGLQFNTNYKAITCWTEIKCIIKWIGSQVAVYNKQYSNRKRRILFNSSAFSDFTVKLISTYNRRRTTEFGFIQCTVNTTGDDITSIRNVNLNISFHFNVLSSWMNKRMDGWLVCPSKWPHRRRSPVQLQYNHPTILKYVPIHSWCAVPVQLYLFRPSYISVQPTATKRMTAEVWGCIVK